MPNPACIICESTEKIKTYDSTHQLFQCKGCDHMFTLIDEQYSQKDIYTEDYFDSSHKNWFKYPNYALFQYIHESILKQVKKKDFKLLDIGSGRGDFLNYLRNIEPASDLCGIDGAPCRSDQFKFIQGDFMKEEIGLKFDVITSLACIEHVQDPDLFVRKIKDLLLPQGIAVIMTNNSGGMMYTLARILNKIGMHAPYNRLYSDHHIHHFTNQSLRKILEKYGFKIKSQINHNFNLASVDYPPSGFVMALLYKIFTAIIFFLSTVFQNGFLQTVVCVPEN